MFVLQVSFRNHDSHKLYYDLYQGDGRVIDMEIIFYNTELNHNVNFLACCCPLNSLGFELART